MGGRSIGEGVWRGWRALLIDGATHGQPVEGAMPVQRQRLVNGLCTSAGREGLVSTLSRVSAGRSVTDTLIGTVATPTRREGVEPAGAAN